jgi:hypothetical protein
MWGRGPTLHKKFFKKISLTLIFDKNLVQELSILGSMDVNVILQLFKSVANNVQLVRGHHHILKIKMVM